MPISHGERFLYQILRSQTFEEVGGDHLVRKATGTGNQLLGVDGPEFRVGSWARAHICDPIADLKRLY